MKFVLVTLLLAASALAKQKPAALPAACGPKNVSFSVKLDKSQHTLAQPETGKARIYFIQDLGPDNYVGVINVGLDGAWVGANMNNSYFSISVVPGEHHVCEKVKSHFFTYGRLVELGNFIAQAGEIYYFRARLVEGENSPFLFLDPVGSDEGKYLVATFPLSVSQPTK